MKDPNLVAQEVAHVLADAAKTVDPKNMQAHTTAAVDVGGLIQEGIALINTLSQYGPQYLNYALTVLRTLASIWGGSKTGS